MTPQPERDQTSLLVQLLSAVLVLLLTLVPLTGGSRQAPALVTGLDHIIILVNDLEAAASRYRAMGFALKAGRPHDNGIRNQHVKFEDGTELELLTAPEGKDQLTTQYRRYLAQGDGPAHVVLYAPDADALAKRIVGGEFGARRDGLITFPIGHRLRPIFFGGRNKSPTDRPEHFAHSNSAYSLTRAWLALEEVAPELKLFAAVGGSPSDEDVQIPEPARVRTVIFGADRILLLPGSRQRLPGRPVIGASVVVKELSAVRRALQASGLKPVSATSGGILLPPELTCGIWLEFRGRR
jgi:catechol 2,3-dioxygenase-like lactoylglutathione lyase family enzyme